MATHEVGKSTVCPTCFKVLDMATNAPGSDDKPEPGDVTMCLDCGTILLFADDMTLRLPTPGEMDILKTDYRIIKLLEAQRHVVDRKSKVQ